MNQQKQDDIAKGHTIVPSHHPMPGVDDKPIDAGIPENKQQMDKEKREKEERNRPETGIAPATDKSRLF